MKKYNYQLTDNEKITTISWQTMKKHNYQLADNEKHNNQLADNEKSQLSAGRQ